MQDLRDELEELAFRHINPEAHATVTGYLQDLAEKNKTLTEEISANLEERLTDANIQATVKSRQKKPYSVFRKMELKDLGLEQLSDIYGFRVIVDTIEECYRTLGLIHTNWPMVPGKFKDFISMPKQNEYRSIHTTVIGPSNQRVELQIRVPHLRLGRLHKQRNKDWFSPKAGKMPAGVFSLFESLFDPGSRRLP